MKQETLKEVAEKFYNDRTDRLPSPTSHWIRSKDLQIDCFIRGSEWKQEQILEFLYSEITERRDYSASKMCEKVIDFIEQFKY